MKCISLWQPWAWAWARGIKLVETRHWPCPPSLIGQRVAVHGAKKWDAVVRSCCDSPNFLRALGLTCYAGDEEIRALVGGEEAFGAIVGVVRLVACERTERLRTRYGFAEYLLGNFSAGRFGWIAEEPTLFATPVPYRGQQGIFDVPDAVVARALEGRAMEGRVTP